MLVESPRILNCVTLQVLPALGNRTVSPEERRGIGMEKAALQVFTENNSKQGPSSPPLDPITVYMKAMCTFCFMMPGL